MSATERNRQIEALIREHQDLAIKEFERVVRKLESLEKQVGILQRIVAEGEQMQYPWFHIKGDMNGHKCKQVEKVLEYLKAHPSINVLGAIQATFEPDSLGYNNFESLKSYCYRIKLDGYR